MKKAREKQLRFLKASCPPTNSNIVVYSYITDGMLVEWSQLQGSGIATAERKRVSHFVQIFRPKVFRSKLKFSRP